MSNRTFYGSKQARAYSSLVLYDSAEGSAAGSCLAPTAQYDFSSIHKGSHKINEIPSFVCII